MATTIAVLSQKGGTGKTTTVRTLTDVYRRIGLEVLAVDLDPQGNLSDYFDVPADADPTVADVRFDDPTVSRRHALIHCEEGSVRILDDRSLNGVFLNAERIDWHQMADGDCVTIGRFDLHYVCLHGPAVPGGRSALGASVG